MLETINNFEKKSPYFKGSKGFMTNSSQIDINDDAYLEKEFRPEKYIYCAQQSYKLLVTVSRINGRNLRAGPFILLLCRRLCHGSQPLFYEGSAKPPSLLVEMELCKRASRRKSGRNCECNWGNGSQERHGARESSLNGSNNRIDWKDKPWLEINYNHFLWETQGSERQNFKKRKGWNPGDLLQNCKIERKPGPKFRRSRNS